MGRCIPGQLHRGWGGGGVRAWGRGGAVEWTPRAQGRIPGLSEVEGEDEPSKSGCVSCRVLVEWCVLRAGSLAMSPAMWRRQGPASTRAALP